MGASYGTIYLGTSQNRRVRRAVEALASEERRFLVAPAIGGWIAVYPQDHGQDEAVARQVAAAVGGTALYVTVHDEDLFAYILYRDGEPVDEYCSQPDYFEPVSQTERERSQGRPDLLAALLGRPELSQPLEAVLHPEEGAPLLASFMLRDFARMLKLPNPLTAYEYLREEHLIDRVIRWCTIKGLWRFRHFPDLKAAKKLARQRRGRREEGYRQLREQGLLVFRDQGKIGWIFTSEPRVVSGGSSDGFLATWSNDLIGVRHYRPQWKLQGELLSGSGQLPPDTMLTSRSGRYLACAWLNNDEAKTQLWDLEQRKQIWELNGAAYQLLDFSPDEERLLAADDDKIVQINRRGEVQKRIKNRDGVYRGVFEPTGESLLLVCGGELKLVNSASGRAVRHWVLGEPVDHSEVMTELQEGMLESFKEFDSEQVARQYRKLAKQFRFSEADTEAMLAELEENHRQMLATLESPDFMEEMGAQRGSEMAVGLRFTAGGRLLVVNTDRGLRVYEWEKFLLSGSDASATGSDKPNKPPREQAPAPRYCVDGRPYGEEGEEEHHHDSDDAGPIDAVVCDEPGQRVLFAGQGGQIDSLDLTTGETRTLVALPGRPGIDGLALSADRSVLISTAVPQFFRDSRKIPAELCVWNYAELLRSGRARQRTGHVPN
jgi:hypothetical protein